MNIPVIEQIDLENPCQCGCEDYLAEELEIKPKSM